MPLCSGSVYFSQVAIYILTSSYFRCLRQAKCWPRSWGLSDAARSHHCLPRRLPGQPGGHQPREQHDQDAQPRVQGPRASHHPRLSTHSDANHKTNILRGGVPTISVILPVITAFCSAIWNGFVEGLYMALKIIIPNQITLSQLPTGQYFLLQVLN